MPCDSYLWRRLPSSGQFLPQNDHLSKVGQGNVIFYKHFCLIKVCLILFETEQPIPKLRYILQVFPREDLAGCLLHGYEHRVIDYDGDVQDVRRARFQIKRLTLFILTFYCCFRYLILMCYF